MRSVALIASFFLPTVALAAPRTFSELANMIVNLINGGIGVALILGIVIYFWGIVSSMPRSGKADSEKLRTQLLWGMIALFVMFSVWGILALLRNTLFGGGGGANFGGGGGDQVLCDSLDDCVIDE